MAVKELLARQNADGGWSYVRGRTWTEPTTYAVMALASAGETKAASRGINWLRQAQRKDGGWPPQLGVEESTWVTALAALVPPELLGSAAHGGAIRWLVEVTGEESTIAHRVRALLLGQSRPEEQKDPGWPWVPGAAAWVGPTALTILALEKSPQGATPRLRERVAHGRGYLISRMCEEGGWNHGSARALGYDLPPYPETTGLGLMALRGADTRLVGRSLALARKFLGDCRSAEASCWLRLGLLAQGEKAAATCPTAPAERRTTNELALEALVESAAAGRNSFWN
jgi:hypothetical protein